MCGIAGYIGTRKLSQDIITNTLKVMHHRGPDYASFRHFAGSKNQQVYLLHTRLNIIDLEPRSNQPFSNAGSWIAYNGELYNYLEIRNEMRSCGHSFRTESDTEVLLNLIREYGWAGLERAEGMWAFALYDEKEEKLILGRDRFGEKPLYLYRDATGFYFASEVKGIFALLGHKLDINYDHLYRYLVNGYKSLYKRPDSFFRGLEELAPATVLTLDRDRAENRHLYWKPRYAPRESMTYDEAVEGARERLIRSVELRLRADVPLAFCMSGGVDSASLISIAKNHFGYDVHGFTIANTDERYEEQEMVDCLIKTLGIRHTSIPVDTQDFLPRLRRLVRQHDAPVYTITYYAQWLLMEAISRNGYRISVSGSAADELFTGYFDHHLAYLYEVREEPALYMASREAWKTHIQPIVRNPYLKNPDLFIEAPDKRDHIYLNADAFAAYLKEPWGEPFYEKEFTPSLLRKRMLNEMFHEAVPVILHEDDLNAMSYSIENRSPFLDRDLFEFCYSIPSQHLIRDGRAKSVLRDAMKGLVPEPVRINRRKVGFNAPIYSFLDVGRPDVREALLEASPIFDHVDRGKIETLIQNDHLPNSESKFLFYFLASKFFLEEFSS